MNYFVEIEKLVKVFCENSPEPNERFSYLEKSSKLYQLYMDVSALGEEEGNDDKIFEVYKQIKNIVE